MVLATSWGGTTYPWGSAVIIGLFAGSVVLLAGWWLSARYAAEPVLPLRLFRNSVFSVSAGISLAAGFALFGTVSFLPLFLQVVHGVSPTISGVYLLPQVVGLLITSIGSGQLIARTGRYKIYPIVGTALLVRRAVPAVPAGRAHLHRAHVRCISSCSGSPSGLILQVLVIAVQNSADYADLGAATSGATFFRSIGGVVRGVRVRRDLLQPAGQRAGLGAARRDAAARAQDRERRRPTPQLLKKLPAAIRADVQHAYSLALHPVFLYAIPVALVAFVLSWFLREVPLRTTSSVGIGEGLGAAPTARSSVDEVERSLARLAGADLRRRGYERLTAMAGLDLPAGSSWILTRLAKQGSVAGEELARQANVTVDYGRPYVDRLVSAGLVTRSNGTLVLTDSGHQAADRLFAARREGLRELLADWSPERVRRAGRTAHQAVPRPARRGCRPAPHPRRADRHHPRRRTADEEDAKPAQRPSAPGSSGFRATTTQ